MATRTTTIEFEGESAEFSISAIGVEEYREIKRKLKLTIRRFIEGIEELDPDAVTALYWLFKRRAGHQDLALDADMVFDIFPFMEAWNEADEKAEPDPTQGGSRPDGSIPALNGSSMTTSATSAMSISSSSPLSAESGVLN